MLTKLRRRVVNWITPDLTAEQRAEIDRKVDASYEIERQAADAVYRAAINEWAETRARLAQTNLVIALLLRREGGVIVLTVAEQKQLRRWQFASQLDAATGATVLILKEDILQ